MPSLVPECQKAQRQVESLYPPGSHKGLPPGPQWVRLDRPANWAVRVSFEVALLVTTPAGIEASYVDMSDGDLHTFLMELALEGIDVTRLYGGLEWKWDRIYQLMPQRHFPASTFR